MRINNAAVEKLDVISHKKIQFHEKTVATPSQG